MRFVRPPWGVLVVGLFLLSVVLYALVTSPADAFGAFVLAGIAGVALGLLLLRPWAWWAVLMTAALCALGGALIVLSHLLDLQASTGQSRPDLATGVAMLAGGLTLTLYFMSAPVRAAFTGKAGEAEAFPQISLGCFVILGLIIGLPGLFVMIVYISCLTGGEYL